MRPGSLWIIGSFVLGMCVAFGLSYISDKASIPSIESRAVFEVKFPDGSIRHLSYPEIERDREDLKILREKIRLMETHREPAKTAEKPVLLTQPQPSPQENKSVPPSVDQPKPSPKNLSDIFSRLMASSTMKELVDEQISREAGELAAVLNLNKEEKAKLERILNKRGRVSAALSTEADKASETPERTESTKSVDDELHAMLTPEQLSRYQEYTEKKKALSGATGEEKDLLELKYRLNITEEQEGSVRQILKEQGEKIRYLSLTPTSEEEGTPLQRIQGYLDQRTAVDKETAQRMQQILSPNQYADFIQYQEEKAAEVRVLRKLLEEEAKSKPTS